MLPRRFRVRRVVRELADVRTLHLEPLEGEPLRFAPGQFNMLYLFAVGEVAISISGDPGSPEPLIHTIRSVGPVTRALCGVRPGGVVGVRGPYGVPWPVARAEGRDVVVVAGGVGLAPLRPVVYELLRRRDRYGRVSLLVGARTPRDLLYARQLEQWRARFDLEVELTVGSAPVDWKGNVGVVTSLLARVAFDPEETVAMVCGPEVMMRHTSADLQARGVPPDHVYLSMERNMKCAVGFCGHCQLGPSFICKDGPVFSYPNIAPYLTLREA
jgi:NAD(P)H-flavin reductase